MPGDWWAPSRSVLSISGSLLLSWVAVTAALSCLLPPAHSGVTHDPLYKISYPVSHWWLCFCLRALSLVLRLDKYRVCRSTGSWPNKGCEHFLFFFDEHYSFHVSMFMSLIYFYLRGRGMMQGRGHYLIIFLCGYSVPLTAFIKYSFIFNLGIVCVFLIIMSLPLGGDSIARKLCKFGDNLPHAACIPTYLADCNKNVRPRPFFT